jgi:hypothetical protein
MTGYPGVNRGSFLVRLYRVHFEVTNLKALSPSSFSAFKSFNNGSEKP